MMLSTPTSSMSPATPASTSVAAQPAANDAASPGAAPGVATPGVATPRAALPQQFAQWLGQQAAVQDLPGTVPDAAAVARPGETAATPPQDAPADEQADADTAAAPDAALLAAMAMPLMPLSPAQVAQAVQAAQPASAGRAEADADARETPALAVDAAGQEGGRRAAATPATPLPAAPAAATPAVPAVAEAAPRAAAQPDGAAIRLAVRTGAAGADGRDGAEPAAAPAPAGAAPLAGAASVTAAQPAPDTVKLAGPPTAWRQSLQEALGDRLQLQVGRNVEQAVIRLEPPQLGRIDIAIRHSAGVLEVNISASNGEVLRQLQAVGDNLRSDLSQRQYSEVAVTVAPTPRNGAAPFGDPQQQGRGRQQGRDQDESAPGRALAEAGDPGSVFSLGGRA